MNDRYEYQKNIFSRGGEMVDKETGTHYQYQKKLFSQEGEWVDVGAGSDAEVIIGLIVSLPFIGGGIALALILRWIFDWGIWWAYIGPIVCCVILGYSAFILKSKGKRVFFHKWFNIISWIVLICDICLFNCRLFDDIIFIFCS